MPKKNKYEDTTYIPDGNAHLHREVTDEAAGGTTPMVLIDQATRTNSNTANGEPARKRNPTGEPARKRNNDGEPAMKRNSATSISTGEPAAKRTVQGEPATKRKNASIDVNQNTNFLFRHTREKQMRLGINTPHSLLRTPTSALAERSVQQHAHARNSNPAGNALQAIAKDPGVLKAGCQKTVYNKQSFSELVHKLTMRTTR